MKPSRYNYIIPHGDVTLFFNGITDAFFEVPQERAHIYSAVLASPNLYASSFESFILKLKNKGFILDDEVDENNLVENKYVDSLNKDEYRIMILPTYQCNVRCWYCVQHHQSIRMTDETIESIKALILNVCGMSDIKRVRISWFGGEPLLEYSIVKDLTAYTKAEVEKSGKHFDCDITTNGTLLNEDRILELYECGVSSYQITIDGEKAVHDKIKVLSNKSAFDTSINNINLIARYTPCTIRFNYTPENLTPERIIEDLMSRLDVSNLHNINFMLYKVWQANQSDIDEAKVAHLVELSGRNGLVPQLPTCNLCYADHQNFVCIFPNGKVDKCDNKPLDEAQGKIENGQIVWAEDNPSHVSAYRNNRYPCRSCKHLPVCWGPCVARRATDLSCADNPECWYDDKDGEITRFILNKCENAKQIGIVFNSMKR